MWQAYILPSVAGGLLSLGFDPITGPLRSGRKAARIDAAHMAREFYVRIGEKPTDRWSEKLPVKCNQIVTLTSSGYGQPFGVVGVRWQPEED